MEAALEKAFAASAGFDVPTIVFTPRELTAVAADAEELAAEHSGLLYVSLLKDAPTAAAVKKLDGAGKEGERAEVRGRAAHLLLGEGLPLGEAEQRGRREAPRGRDQPQRAGDPHPGREVGRRRVSDLAVARSGAVLTLTLDRPDQLNALTDELSDALAGELEAAAPYDDVRVVVLRGAGRAFCAGADIAGADAPMQLDVRALDRANRIVRAITASRQARAWRRSTASAAGVGLLDRAGLRPRGGAPSPPSFLLAFARIGLMPDGGSSASVAASIGRARAMRMALLAEPLSGREAYDAGLVSHLADDDAFETVVADVVGRLAAGAAAGPGRHQARGQRGDLRRAGRRRSERERTGQTMLLRTRDAAEGMRAFAERRAPDFEGE